MTYSLVNTSTDKKRDKMMKKVMKKLGKKKSTFNNEAIIQLNQFQDLVIIETFANKYAVKYQDKDHSVIMLTGDVQNQIQGTYCHGHVFNNRCPSRRKQEPKKKWFHYIDAHFNNGHLEGEHVIIKYDNTILLGRKEFTIDRDPVVKVSNCTFHIDQLQLRIKNKNRKEFTVIDANFESGYITDGNIYIKTSPGIQCSIIKIKNRQINEDQTSLHHHKLHIDANKKKITSHITQENGRWRGILTNHLGNSLVSDNMNITIELKDEVLSYYNLFTVSLPLSYKIYTTEPIHGKSYDVYNELVDEGHFNINKGFIKA